MFDLSRGIGYTLDCQGMNIEWDVAPHSARLVYPVRIP
jgi:hypothetical protein